MLLLLTSPFSSASAQESSEEDGNGAGGASEGSPSATSSSAEAAPAGDPEQRARALMLEGIAARREGLDEEALAKFREAHEIFATPVALAQMGFAEQAMGRWLEAEQHLREAARESEHPWIAANITFLQRSLDEVRARIGRLFVSFEEGAEVEGAAVFIDGEQVGTLPMERPIWVVAGSAVLEVRAEGYFTRRRNLEILPGGTTREQVRLTEHGALGQDGEGGTTIIVQQGPPPDILGPLFWVQAVAAVIGVAAFTGTGVTALSAHDRYLACNDGGCIDDSRTLGQQMSLATDVGFAITGALAISALVTLLVDSPWEDEEDEEDGEEQEDAGEGVSVDVALSPHLSPWLSPSSGGLSAEWRL